MSEVSSDRAAGEPGEALIPDDSRVVRWAGPLFVIFSVVLLPWTFWLAVSLPPRSVSGHYALAWSGFDAMLTASMLWTGWTALRRSSWLAVAATATATLLVVDAWFDVLTSSERLDQVQALILAVLVELPLAGVCAWLARHSEELTQSRLRLALTRQGPKRKRISRRHPADGGPPRAA